MTKKLLTTLSLAFVVVLGVAQTTILDFETPETSTSFQYFGSTLDGTLNEIVANPDVSGENTSPNVAHFTKPAVAEVWAGAFSNPDPGTPIDLVSNGRISMKVYMDHIGSVSLKLEGSTDGGDNWVITVPNTKVNEWETLVFDASIPSIEAPNTAASGYTYARLVLFFDLGTPGTGTDVVSYFDDITALPLPAVETRILDFETAETTTDFQYFGSTLDGTFTQVVDNPNVTGLNTSDSVVVFVKPAVAEVWAGAFSNPNPATPVSFDNGGQICVKVLMDHIGNLALKLEGSTSGAANWIQQVSNTVVGDWEELCFDSSLPSLEAPFETASGTYERIVLFFDFGTGGSGTDVTSYFDDIVVKGSSVPTPRTINFAVDMNQYTQNFDTVYVSGSFNNWDGRANPLADPDFDGIWEGSIMVPNGAYDYKITLDNWDAQEEFTGTEECTRVDPGGQFVNRLLTVAGDRDIAFCYNSCYACGEEVTITFQLGMGEVVPNPEGVWLAGGGNFEVPGGRYEMHDDDGDGIYEVVVPRMTGFSSFYTFANGPCADYSCKEDLTGLPCGDPDNFNDRFLPEVTEDIVVATCFGTCFTNALCTTGTEQPEQNEGVFEIIGNPSSDATTYLSFGNDFTSDKRILLTNLLGQVHGSYVATGASKTFSLPTENLHPGIYLVTVTTDDMYYTRKLIRK